MDIGEITVRALEVPARGRLSPPRIPVSPRACGAFRNHKPLLDVISTTKSALRRV